MLVLYCSLPRQSTIYRSASTWLTLRIAPRLHSVRQLTAYLTCRGFFRTWTSSCTSGAARPDIACAIGVLGRQMVAPTEELWTAAKGVLRCLRGSLTVGLIYGNVSP